MKFKDLNKLVFKVVTDNIDAYAYIPLDTITETDILKNSSIFNIFINKLKDQKQLEKDLNSLALNFNGCLYSEIEREYSNESDEFIDKKYNRLSQLMDTLYLNTKIYHKGKEYTSIEFEDKDDMPLKDIIKSQTFFFLLMSLLQSPKKLDTNDRIGTMTDTSDIYLTSLDIGQFITFIQSTNKTN